MKCCNQRCIESDIKMPLNTNCMRAVKEPRIYSEFGPSLSGAQCSAKIYESILNFESSGKDDIPRTWIEKRMGRSERYTKSRFSRLKLFYKFSIFMCFQPVLSVVISSSGFMLPLWIKFHTFDRFIHATHSYEEETLEQKRTRANNHSYG